jgi:hypothetical protein
VGQDRTLGKRGVQRTAHPVLVTAVPALSVVEHRLLDGRLVRTGGNVELNGHKGVPFVGTCRNFGGSK